MKGLIIVNAYAKEANQLNQPLRLKEEFEKIGVEADIRALDVSACGISDGNIAVKYRGYDFCVFYDKDKHALLQLEKSGLKCFNRYSAMTACDDKMLTYIKLAGVGIPMPETYSAPLCYSPYGTINGDSVDFLADKLGFPMIVKECYGSLGKGVHIVRDKAELADAADRLRFVPHVYQKFIAESEGTDLRVIVVGGKYVGAMKRTSSGDFRSNVSAGGRGETFEADEKTVALAEKIARVLEIDYCGIDFLFGKNGLILCEVNSNAFFKEFEKVTGINVAEKYAAHIIRNVRIIRSGKGLYS